MADQKKVSRRRFLALSSSAAAASVLAACGAPEVAGTTASTAASASAQASASTAAGVAASAPAVAKGTTVSYWVGLTPQITATRQSMAELTTYQELMKATGITIQFQHPPTDAAQAREQFNLMIASGKYPDIIEQNWVNGYISGGPSKALRDGIIIRLNDLIDQHAPNLKRVLDEHPEWRKQIVTDEGDIYCFPFFRGDPVLQTFTGLAMRGDWLNKLGLKPPTTIDEWTTVLTAMKDKDPNGNGKADEWAFNPWLDAPNIRNALNLSHAFIGAYGITADYYQDNGVVKYGPLQPEFKQFLQTMADWNKAGLIDPDWVTQDQKAYDARMTNNQLGAGILRLGGGIGKFTGLMKEQNPEFALIGVPYPTLKAGERPMLGQREPAYPGGGSAAITTAAKDPVAAVQLLDYGYSPEGHMLFNFGKEGLTYTLENGYPKYTDLIMNNPDKLPVAQAMSAHFRSNGAGPFVQDKRYAEQFFQLPVQQDAYKIWSEPSNERLLPTLSPSQDESRRFNEVMTEINTRYEEAITKIVTGAQPVDSWDAVVAEFKGMGIEEAISIQQAALDRYNKRA